MRKQARTASSKPAHIPCDHPGCKEEGEYRAPKSRQHVEEGKLSERYLHFCLEHVREYNKQWDYFAQMSHDEIERFQRDAVVGHRKTKPIGGRNNSPFFAQQDAWFFGFDTSTHSPAQPQAKPELTKPQRAAMAVMNLAYPFTEKDLKARYRVLVKKYHPDTNGGDKKAEALFKEITEAYRVLKEI
jgi:hypothetical protein